MNDSSNIICAACSAAIHQTEHGKLTRAYGQPVCGLRCRNRMHQRAQERKCQAIVDALAKSGQRRATEAMVWTFQQQGDGRPTGCDPVRQPRSVARQMLRDKTHKLREVVGNETPRQAHDRCVELIRGKWQWREVTLDHQDLGRPGDQSREHYAAVRGVECGHVDPRDMAIVRALAVGQETIA